MSKFGVARVTIDSPLPQLDRLFDYEIPEALADTVTVGVRVKVPFGRGKSLNDGFVVAISDNSDFEGKLAELAAVVSPAPVLAPQIYELVRAVADRQAATAADVLRLAIPARSVAVEKKWLDQQGVKVGQSITPQAHTPTRTSVLVNPVTTGAGPAWALHLLAKARQQAALGKSTIMVVPDFRDIQVLLDLIREGELAPFLIDYSSDQKNSTKYSGFLNCLSNEISIVVGSRSALYAPVRNLGAILVWDDGDSSHQEPSSPYAHSREVALIRQRLSDCNIAFLSHARSTELQRLVEIGYLHDNSSSFEIPDVTTVDREVRLDGVAWATIRESLKLGPVLIQVSSKGNAVSAYCAACSERAACVSCHGPLWADSANHIRCRWCNRVNQNFRCATCGSQKLRTGGAGATRTISEFGKAFPGVSLIESTAEHKRESIPEGTHLVVATPGAEPRAPGGYSAVIVLDANHALNRDSLRATEDAVRSWTNAIALLGQQGKAVIVGIGGALAQQISEWKLASLAHQELVSRQELRFPPAVRMASISADANLLAEVLEPLKEHAGIEILGPMAIYERNVLITWRALIKYEYAKGEWLAKHLKAAMLVHSAGQSAFSAKSGRPIRPIRVKMDDSEVI